MKHSTVGAIAAGLALTMGTSSCARAHGPASDANAYRSTVVAEPGMPWQLQFTTPTLDGSTFSGHDLYGKPAALCFWSPDQHASEQHAAQAAADAHPYVTFTGILDTQPRADTELDDQPHTGMTQLVDLNAAIASRFGITSRPAYVFITDQGQISIVRKALTQRELQTHLKQLAVG